MLTRYRLTDGWIFPGLLALSLTSGCTPYSSGPGKASKDHAFISYWPPAESGGLRVAVKDLIDIKGQVTSAGSEYVSQNTPPAKRDADCLAIARQRNVVFVGKTNLTEFAITVSGRNPYFGTPVNRWDGKQKFIPGGSSSGSAVAVETGRADVAIGTDTGGSIRVPAAFCGVYGLKTTFGLISTRGVFPISPKNLDTVGPLAKDLPRLVEGMDLLESGFASKYRSAVAAHPYAEQIKIGRLYIDGTDPAIDKAIDAALVAKGFKVINLDATFKSQWMQGEADGKVVALADAWVSDQKYADKQGVGATTKLVLLQGQVNYATTYKAALKRKAVWQRALRRVFEKVDFVALPTLKSLPPKFPLIVSPVIFEWLIFNSQNTVAVNFAGNPALAMPIAMPKRGIVTPLTSLQLIGKPRGEAEILNAARLIESPR